MPGMIETATRGLDVRLNSVELRGAVVHQGIQTGQAGAGGQEDRQQEERLGPEEA